MIFHTINKSPYHQFNLLGTLEVPQNGDSILFYEDGVYACMEGTDVGKLLSMYNDDITLYALDSDIEARGLSNRLIQRVMIIDYDGFVDLCVKAIKVVNW